MTALLDVLKVATEKIANLEDELRAVEDKKTKLYILMERIRDILASHTSNASAVMDIQSVINAYLKGDNVINAYLKGDKQ